jgi:large conductance mechanosensitive channel
MKDKIKGIVKEFEDFAVKGNVVDLAVGIIVGGAFTAIVNSLVGDIINPALSLILGKVNFANRFVALSNKHFTTVADAQAAGVATLNYGLFINAIINFLIVAFIIFLIVRQLNKLRTRLTHPKTADDKQAVAESTTMSCPFCKSVIQKDATRCPFCTSEIGEDAKPAAAKA